MIFSSRILSAFAATLVVVSSSAQPTLAASESNNDVVVGSDHGNLLVEPQHTTARLLRGGSGEPANNNNNQETSVGANADAHAEAFKGVTAAALRKLQESPDAVGLDEVRRSLSELASSVGSQTVVGELDEIGRKLAGHLGTREGHNSNGDDDLHEIRRTLTRYADPNSDYAMDCDLNLDIYWYTLLEGDRMQTWHEVCSEVRSCMYKYTWYDYDQNSGWSYEYSDWYCLEASVTDLEGNNKDLDGCSDWRETYWGNYNSPQNIYGIEKINGYHSYGGCTNRFLGERIGCALQTENNAYSSKVKDTAEKVAQLSPIMSMYRCALAYN